jgi:hypothetical protein
MPLPDPSARPVQAPAYAGVGLRARIEKQREERPPANWPEDWWQRNYDLLLEPQGPEPVPLSGRQLKLPPPPAAPK